MFKHWKGLHVYPQNIVLVRKNNVLSAIPYQSQDWLTYTESDE